MNGVDGDAIDLTPAIHANQKTVTLVDGVNTTVGSTVSNNNTEYKVNVSEQAIQDAVTLVGDVTGKVGQTKVEAIQGVAVSDEAPTKSGQTLVYDDATKKWIIGTPNVNAEDVLNPKSLTAAEGDPIVVTGGEGATLVDVTVSIKDESITSDHIKNGTIKAEDIANAGANQVLVTRDDKKPMWKDKNKVAPQFFYMPAVIFDTSATGTATRDLYEEYVNQFTGGSSEKADAVTYDISHGPAGTTPLKYSGGIIASEEAPEDIAVFKNDELHYYVTYYDESVFENLSITKEGKLTYTVKSGATPSSYMNIVFVIK